jgi:hypothetical protein
VKYISRTFPVKGHFNGRRVGQPGAFQAHDGPEVVAGPSGFERLHCGIGILNIGIVELVVVQLDDLS